MENLYLGNTNENFGNCCKDKFMSNEKLLSWYYASLSWKIEDLLNLKISYNESEVWNSLYRMFGSSEISYHCSVCNVVFLTKERVELHNQSDEHKFNFLTKVFIVFHEAIDPFLINLYTPDDLESIIISLNLKEILKVHFKIDKIWQKVFVGVKTNGNILYNCKICKNLEVLTDIEEIRRHILNSEHKCNMLRMFKIILPLKQLICEADEKNKLPELEKRNLNINSRVATESVNKIMKYQADVKNRVWKSLGSRKKTVELFNLKNINCKKFRTTCNGKLYRFEISKVLKDLKKNVPKLKQICPGILTKNKRSICSIPSSSLDRKININSYKICGNSKEYTTDNVKSSTKVNAEVSLPSDLSNNYLTKNLKSNIFSRRSKLFEHDTKSQQRRTRAKKRRLRKTHSIHSKFGGEYIQKSNMNSELKDSSTKSSSNSSRTKNYSPPVKKLRHKSSLKINCLEGSRFVSVEEQCTEYLEPENIHQTDPSKRKRNAFRARRPSSSGTSDMTSESESIDDYLKLVDILSLLTYLETHLGRKFKEKIYEIKLRVSILVKIKPNLSDEQLITYNECTFLELCREKIIGQIMAGFYSHNKIPTLENLARSITKLVNETLEQYAKKNTNKLIVDKILDNLDENRVPQPLGVSHEPSQVLSNNLRYNKLAIKHIKNKLKVSVTGGRRRVDKVCSTVKSQSSANDYNSMLKSVNLLATDESFISLDSLKIDNNIEAEIKESERFKNIMKMKWLRNP